MEKAKLNRCYGLDLRSLALFRVFLGLIIIYDLCIRYADLSVFYSDQGAVPRSLIPRVTNEWLLSLHLINGTSFVQSLLFLLAFAAAFFLLIGFKTRLFCFLSWLLACSIQARNPIILSQADFELRILLFWAMFLPLNTYFSIDSALKSSEKRETEIHSIATFALMTQIIIIYWSTAILKTGPEWHQEGSAIAYALLHEQYVTALGQKFLMLPASILKLMTHATLWFEYIGPLLLILPFAKGRLRLLAISGFFALHLGFAFTLRLGIFPYVAMAAFTAVLPHLFWEKVSTIFKKKKGQNLTIYYDNECGFCMKSVHVLKTMMLLSESQIKASNQKSKINTIMQKENSWVVEDHNDETFLRFDAFIKLCNASPLFFIFSSILRLRLVRMLGTFVYNMVAKNRQRLSWSTALVHTEKEPKLKPSRTEGILIALVIASVILWNIQIISKRKLLPNPIKAAIYVLRLDQNWHMYAPAPPKVVSWLVAEGDINSDQKIDILTGNSPVKWDKPPLISKIYKSWRWRGYHRLLMRRKYKTYRPYYAAWLCKTWNRERKESQQIKSVKIFQLWYKNQLGQPPTSPKKHLLIEKDC